MTVVILHPPGRALPPYQQWLAGTDLILVTGPAVDAHGFVDIRSVVDYGTSARVETTVLDIASTTAVTGIVASDAVDHIRAGGLRDHLGLPGPGRDAVLGIVDGVRVADRLGEASVPRGRVRRAIDLHWYAHKWGYPLSIRSRRASGWPVVAVLQDETELRAFAGSQLPTDLEVMPSLMVEAVVPGKRVQAVVSLNGVGGCVMYEDIDAPGFPEHAAEVLTALGVPVGWPYRVESVLSGGTWLAETIASEDALPGVVLAQVALPAALAQVV